MLALPAPECDADKESLVVCGLCFRQRLVEPAGRSFHFHVERPVLERRRKGRPDVAAKQAEAGEADDGDVVGDASWRKKKKEAGDKRGMLKLSSLLEGEDLYKLLEVTEAASVDQIKKQYRKLALAHHPDKQGDDTPSGKKDKSGGLSDKDQHFIKIQEAYEVLSDTTRRRQYDSTLDFDDDVPDDIDEALGFYGTFGPVFTRNARFSCRHPVPDLGDDNTNIDKVHRFYDFWVNFESWRDFSMHDEYNLDEAEFREERRWMDRQNQKIRKKHVDGERRRVMRLAETAERLDPRIRAEREEREAKKREEKERRARQKQEEEDAKRREEEEKQLKAQREQEEREEKERQEREERKQKQQLAKGFRQRAKKAVQARCSLSAVELDELQDMYLALDTDALEALCSRMDALPAAKDKAADVVRSELAQWKTRCDADREQQARQREEARRREEQRASSDASAGGVPWATEELGLLAKGLQRFPGGVGGRWALIAQMLNTAGFSRTEREVIDKTKEMSEGQSLRSMGSTISADLTSLKPKAAPAAKAAATSGAPAAKAKASAGAPPQAAAAAGAAAAGAAVVTAEPAAEWSPEQQKALEAALQRHPATLETKERWRLIAEDVPGKTKAQCVERFKYLREQLSKQKK